MMGMRRPQMPGARPSMGPQMAGPGFGAGGGLYNPGAAQFAPSFGAMGPSYGAMGPNPGGVVNPGGAQFAPNPGPNPGGFAMPGGANMMDAMQHPFAPRNRFGAMAPGGAQNLQPMMGQMTGQFGGASPMGPMMPGAQNMMDVMQHPFAPRNRMPQLIQQGMQGGMGRWL